MRADKWRRAVGQLLALWEGWCVFASGAHEELVRGFAESAERSGRERVSGEKAAAEEEAAAKRAQGEAKRNAWKAVGDGAAAADGLVGAPKEQAPDEDVDGVPMDEDGSDEDVDGQPMDEDDDVDGEPMEESDVDGEPMDEDDDQPGDGEQEQRPPLPNDDGSSSRAAEASRPKPVDMFADSDGE
jgi:U2-associated protein SR140